jgi:arabinose-5-phosphate isomerase
LIGIITDGDIRRGIEKNYNNFFDQPAKLIMSHEPKTIDSKTLAISALEIMEKHSITSLFVFSDPKLKKPDGIIHIHDILKLGIK